MKIKLKYGYLFLIIILSFMIISCEEVGCNGGTNCVPKISCNNNSDCEDYQYCNPIDGCINNPCLEEELFCGTGTCVPGDDPETEENEYYHCKCDENSLSYKRAFGDAVICTPKCETHADCSEAYVNEGHQVAGACIKGQCNERNRCDTADDCPDGDICDYNLCKPKPIGG